MKSKIDLLDNLNLCEIIPNKDYDKADSPYYILNEDNERIFFLIKSSKEEFCFTNKALIYISREKDNTNVSSIIRYEYYRYKISNVSFEITEELEMLISLRFTIGNKEILLSVDSKELSNLNKLYKSLITIEEMYIQSAVALETASRSIQTATDVLANSSSKDSCIYNDFKSITKFSEEWITTARNKYTLYDLSHVFLKYSNFQ